jgi:glycosyltransferase involved in cell wall biosynthesis
VFDSRVGEHSHEASSLGLSGSHNAGRPSARVAQHSHMRIDTLSGQDIICFAHTPWHGPWKASQQIMSLLAEANRVLYIGPRATLRDAIRSIRAGAKPLPLERLHPRLFIYHEPPLLARIRDDRLLGQSYNRSTGWVRMMHARYQAWRLGFRTPILWIFDPMQAQAARLFQKKLLVYHVLDNYVEFPRPGMTSARAAIARNEERLLKMADVVFAVSRRLHERCLAHNPSSFLVPNGVNYRHFQTAIASGTKPADLLSIRRPIIGYVGVIQADLDFLLLHRLAEEISEGSLVFVGPEDLGGDRPQFEALRRHPNVHYLGAKPVEDVPRYINGCDVCILPYGTDRAAADSDQIKLYEYLACGRPVVSTNLPSVERFEPVVRIARDTNEFVGLVKASLEEDPGWTEQRKRVASQHGWQHRVAALSEAIARRIPSPTREIGEQP